MVTMSTDINVLVREIEEAQKAMTRDEGNLVLHMIGLGELLLKLRRTAGGNWTVHAKKLGFHPRVANRYMQLARSWWGRNGLSESGLLEKMPPDLMKLEWLCRLDREQLVEAVENYRLREWSRTQVIDAVKFKLGVTEEAPQVRSTTVDRIKVDCGRFVERLIESIEDSRPELASAQERQRLLDELSAKFAKVEEVLAVDDGSTLDVSAEQEYDQPADEGEGEAVFSEGEASAN